MTSFWWKISRSKFSFCIHQTGLCWNFRDVGTGLIMVRVPNIKYSWRNEFLYKRVGRSCMKFIEIFILARFRQLALTKRNQFEKILFLFEHCSWALRSVRTCCFYVVSGLVKRKIFFIHLSPLQLNGWSDREYFHYRKIEFTDNQRLDNEVKKKEIHSIKVSGTDENIRCGSARYHKNIEKI